MGLGGAALTSKNVDEVRIASSPVASSVSAPAGAALTFKNVDEARIASSPLASSVSAPGGAALTFKNEKYTRPCTPMQTVSQFVRSTGEGTGLAGGQGCSSPAAKACHRIRSGL